MIIRLAVCFLALILICPISYAETRPFLESWNNLAYYDTNNQQKGFSGTLGHFEEKIGLWLFDLPAEVYGAFLCTSSQSNNYWDNAIYYGPGFRFFPFQGYEGAGWQDEWVRGLKIFAESLSSSYLKNAASAEADGLRTTDVRYGFDLWHEWNLDSPNPNLPWGELWSNLSYRTTNFTSTDFNTYIFYFQPKLGWHLGGAAEGYLKADLVTSGNTSYWLNMVDYGVGLRFEPWRRETTKANEFIRKFKLFAEVLGVNYLGARPTDPNKDVSQDIRFGIDFSYGR
ncbi:MAG: hypothetical protein QME05_07025 [Candidatus Margulisbacteria bacterium]|nr:hypothetical protein [Candidatus Margulisiibacteriota bacterium]